MIYHKLGIIPQKRHVQFRQPDGSLYYEELISTRGFDGILSNIYHTGMPPKVDKIEDNVEILGPVESQKQGLRNYHFRTSAGKRGGDFLFGRKYIVFNGDVWMSIAKPEEEMKYFYKNGFDDELIYVVEGEGELQSFLGNLQYKKGDYIVIPRGVIFRFIHSRTSTFLVLESKGEVRVPKRYLNEFGQFLEHSPFCERDLRLPNTLITSSEKGDFLLKIKKAEKVYTYHYDYHPFDVAGWDGYYFPWIFNIDDFMPITGKIHMPPPIHQTFDGPNYVICSFVSRMLDYHPESIPVPYNHSNIDSDEILFYADGQFSSRKGIENGSISFHPGGIPHGPHPGRVEDSLGKKETVETAVMLDTFKPLKITEFAMDISDIDYPYSWK